MPSPADTYTLFYGTIEMGKVVFEYEDFPRLGGTFTPRDDRDDSSLGQLVWSVYDIQVRSSSMTKRSEIEALESEYESQLKKMLQLASSEDWFLVDIHGDKHSILPPYFHEDAEILWSWNPG